MWERQRERRGRRGGERKEIDAEGEDRWRGVREGRDSERREEGE